jgi:hypothetical protein
VNGKNNSVACELLVEPRALTLQTSSSVTLHGRRESAQQVVLTCDQRIIACLQNHSHMHLNTDRRIFHVISYVFTLYDSSVHYLLAAR